MLTWLLSTPTTRMGMDTSFFGLHAKEIHICGEPSAVPLAKSIYQKTFRFENINHEISQKSPDEIEADTGVHCFCHLNGPNSGFEVLVASDAIGMRLNFCTIYPYSSIKQMLDELVGLVLKTRSDGTRDSYLIKRWMHHIRVRRKNLKI
ncbi:P-loop containing nucleoside triphosphate hydrolase protein [Gigaspora margarita]|uniref:P-loop containing nucleoside triphosphate hydrolase protein n=1 Tax=Gigaspora margarita TaxID=4874 RepID=A0A8H4A5B6_GIGMA|nr:P-loop containing nucleoside triphosphate hydrolase protein [Gigaspora margarita]